MKQYGMLIDVDKCTGCYNCFLACRDEHYGNDFPPISLAQPFEEHFWMQIIERERGKYPKVKVSFIPKPCMHCDDPPCARASANGAIYKRPDGIVIIDPERSVGQKEILSSCPYRVIFWNEEKKIPQKCTLCAHLLDQGWQEPRCVEACPTGALLFGDLEDPDNELSQIWASERVEDLHPEFGIKTRVRYAGIPKRFVAGTVLLKDKDQCAENAKVTLSGGRKKQTLRTNNFGDFEFEDLDIGEFTVKIERTDYSPQSFKVQTRLDVYLGEIPLKRVTPPNPPPRGGRTGEGARRQSIGRREK